MKEAVLLVGHGSRALEANQAMEEIARILKEKGDFVITEVGYMELNPPTIPEGVKACIELGAERIIVLPYFLHMGMHVQRDLPLIIQGCREQYPQVEIVMGRHIGFEPVIADILLERYHEAAHPEYQFPLTPGKVIVRPDVLAHDHSHDHVHTHSHSHSHSHEHGDGCGHHKKHL